MSDLEHERWEGLLPLYAMGAVDGEERDELERHLVDCLSCRRDLLALERDLGTLAEAPGPMEPPPEIRERLLRAVSTRAGEAEASERFSTLRWSSLVGIAAAILLLLAGGLWLQTREAARGLRIERDRLVRELAAAEDRIESLERQQTALVRELQTLRDPSSEHVLLAGLDTAPGASGRTVVSPDGDSARFYAFGLPDLPEEEDYELWLIADGTPVPAGVFDVDARGEAVLDVPSLPALETIEAWAVTVEPAGGGPAPTGTMVLKR